MAEIALIHVVDSRDIDAVKEAFQNRIDGVIDLQSNYINVVERWEDARIVVNGSYIMLIVHSQADDIIDAFNALF